MKKILPIYLSAALTLIPLTEGLAASKQQPIDTSNLKQEEVEKNLNPLWESRDYARNLIGVPDILYQETEEGIAEPVDTAAIQSSRLYDEVVGTFARKVRNSARKLSEILADEDYTAQEDSVALRNNFYVIPENCIEIIAMDNILNQVEKQYGKDSPEYKTLESQIDSAVNYVIKEINPVSGQLMKLHDEKYAPAIEQALKTSWYRELGLDIKDWSTKSIIKKSLWGAAIVSGIYAATRGDDEARVEGGTYGGPGVY